MAAASRTGLSLDELTRVLQPVSGRLIGDGTTRVVDVSQDSRNVGPDFIFVARSGSSARGIEHAPAALSAGARALITSDEAGARRLGVSAIVVEHERKALALAAEALHGYPSRDVKVVAITGTNGKTTVAVLTEFALGLLGARPARVGTLGFSFEHRLFPSKLTTPEADELSRFLAEVRAAGGTHCVLEASSHALSQYRLDGLNIDVGAFTNLTQDHLDYHGDLNSYGEAKARLFAGLKPRASVIHIKDEWSRALATRVSSALRVGQDADCAVRAVDVVCDQSGIHGEVMLPTGPAPVHSSLIGHHNLENLLVVLGIVSCLGFDARRVSPRFSEAPQVPGRLERCDDPADGLTVVVDYAHTPDALERVLLALRAISTGRLICVFGCGGDRDPGKRPLMGAVVGKLADFAVVTNDNPRSEQPEHIAEQIETGLVPTGAAFERVLDRRAAIERAIALAQPGDCVLLAGKGHENYQLIGTQRLDFDDREQARRALAERRQRRGVRV
jgi:UDP-N-acetylmuramoyl-L-alanyl-D-glutamate--2,6-diaminopimelate ligase